MDVSYHFSILDNPFRWKLCRIINPTQLPTKISWSLSHQLFLCILFHKLTCHALSVLLETIKKLVCFEVTVQHPMNAQLLILLIPSHGRFKKNLWVPSFIPSFWIILILMLNERSCSKINSCLIIMSCWLVNKSTSKSTFHPTATNLNC